METLWTVKILFWSIKICLTNYCHVASSLYTERTFASSTKHQMLMLTTAAEKANWSAFISDMNTSCHNAEIKVTAQFTRGCVIWKDLQMPIWLERQVWKFFQFSQPIRHWLYSYMCVSTYCIIQKFSWNLFLSEAD